MAKLLTHRPIVDDFVLELRGVDLTRHKIDGPIFEEILAACDRYGVVILPGQTLTDDQLLGFAERFGPVVKKRGNPERKKTAPPGVAEISNLGPDGALLPPDHPTQQFSDGNRLWHLDLSYSQAGGAVSILNAREVPMVGGETDFSDTARAYDALNEEDKARLEPLYVLHSLRFHREKTGYQGAYTVEGQEPGVFQHKLVCTNPRTGRRSLLIGAHAGHIKGLPEDEAKTLLEDLLRHATQPHFQYSHRWAVGDLVIWDNIRALHRRGDGFDQSQRRSMRRSTVVGALSGKEIVV